jgi:hypothetical protein
MDEPAQTPVSPVVHLPNNNNKIVKIAGIILGIVFVFVLAEAAYYFYNQKQPAIPAETADETVSSPAEEANGTFVKKLDDARGQFDYLAEHGDFFKEASFRTTAEGRVLSSTKENRVVNGNTFVYTLRIQSTKANKPLSYNFSQGELKSMDVGIVPPNGQSIPSRIEEIKEGDLVEIITITNLLSSSTDDSVTINILRPQ